MNQANEEMNHALPTLCIASLLVSGQTWVWGLRVASPLSISLPLAERADVVGGAVPEP